jgi:hypothetical protein
VESCEAPGSADVVVEARPASGSSEAPGRVLGVELVDELAAASEPEGPLNTTKARAINATTATPPRIFQFRDDVGVTRTTP